MIIETGKPDAFYARVTELAASGELDPTMGGRPADVNSSRRSVYLLVDRQFLPGVFRVFDFANPDLHIPQRPSTTVPQQALFFMNSAMSADVARGGGGIRGRVGAAGVRVGTPGRRGARRRSCGSSCSSGGSRPRL